MCFYIFSFYIYLFFFFLCYYLFFFFFFFQAEDGIRDRNVTGVQTCALPICSPFHPLQRCAKISARRNLPARAALCFPISRSVEVDEKVSAAFGPSLPRK